jgi:DedD protein
MATSQNNNNEVETDPSEIKRKLAWRMGIAGLMIVGLLGALALFDRLSTPSEPEASAPQFTEPVPVAKKVVTQPVTPAEPAPEVPKVAATPESSEPPVDKSAPRAEPPQRPAVAAHPALPRASQPAGQTVGRPAASQSRPAAAAVTAAPQRGESPVAALPPAPPRLFSGYALQAGVFSDPRRAEELNARLILEGIPSTIEARVQVGPFKSRAEAEEVRQKMKTMGIDAVMLPPPKAKR